METWKQNIKGKEEKQRKEGEGKKQLDKKKIKKIHKATTT